MTSDSTFSISVKNAVQADYTEYPQPLSTPGTITFFNSWNFEATDVAESIKNIETFIAEALEKYISGQGASRIHIQGVKWGGNAATLVIDIFNDPQNFDPTNHYKWPTLRVALLNASSLVVSTMTTGIILGGAAAVGAGTLGAAAIGLAGLVIGSVVASIVKPQITHFADLAFNINNSDVRVHPERSSYLISLPTEHLGSSYEVESYILDRVQSWRLQPNYFNLEIRVSNGDTYLAVRSSEIGEGLVFAATNATIIPHQFMDRDNNPGVIVKAGEVIQTLTHNDGGYLVSTNLVFGSSNMSQNGGSDLINEGATGSTVTQVYAFGGDDTVTTGFGNDYIHAGDGDDILNGGGGNDFLKGGLGDDQYIYNLDAGQDTIEDGLGLNSDDPSFDTMQLGKDTLIFGEGIDIKDTLFYRSDTDLQIVFRNTAEFSWGGRNRITVIDQFAEKGDPWTPLGMEGKWIDRFVFNDGSEAILGRKANDDLTLEILSNTDNFLDLIISKDQAIYGFDGDDTLEGKGGHDTLFGGVGSDLYKFRAGAGDVSIQEGPAGFDIPSNLDTLRFLDIKRSDVTLEAQEETGISFEDGSNVELSNLVITVDDTQEQVTILDQLDATNTAKIELFEFTDGAIVVDSNVAHTLKGDQYITTRTDNGKFIPFKQINDYIYGFGGNDSIRGLTGDDYLNGGEGNDSLTGGVGDDTIVGGIGDDFYSYNIGDGQDILIEDTTENGGIDTLMFGADLTSRSLRFIEDGDDLILRLQKTQAQIQAKTPDEQVRLVGQLSAIKNQSKSVQSLMTANKKVA